MEGLIFGILRYKPQGFFSKFYGTLTSADSACKKWYNFTSNKSKYFSSARRFLKHGSMFFCVNIKKYFLK